MPICSYRRRHLPRNFGGGTKRQRYSFSSKSENAAGMRKQSRWQACPSTALLSNQNGTIQSARRSCPSRRSRPGPDRMRPHHCTPSRSVFAGQLLLVGQTPSESSEQAQYGIGLMLHSAQNRQITALPCNLQQDRPMMIAIFWLYHCLLYLQSCFRDTPSPLLNRIGI